MQEVPASTRKDQMKRLQTYLWEDARPLPHVGGGVIELELGVTDPL